MRNHQSDPPSQATGRCPACGKPRAQAYRPFCSKACRDGDLLAWLDERYRIPAVDAEEKDQDEPDNAG
ncbi:MAG: DNA gyrase inhibitor YacG [Geminicoccaceae bacterium]